MDNEPMELAAGIAGARTRAESPRARALAPVEADRRRRLGRLGREVATAQVALTEIRAALQPLARAEQARRLTREERERVRDLRWRSEQLWWELRLLRDQFEQLRGAGGR